MIDPSLTAAVQAFQASVTASKPLSALTPLQLAALVKQGNDLIALIDAAAATVGTNLGIDPAGHPLAMIAGVRSLVAAATDATTLADLRGLVGRAVLNLANGAA